ncbi:hypothetical protein DFH09DRAFT_1192913, partial [Mycena vulgaris]
DLDHAHTLLADLEACEDSALSYEDSEDQRSRIVQHIHQGRGLLSAVRSLPFDILSELFTHLHTRRWNIWLLAHVCRLWRATTRALPTLYAHIAPRFPLPAIAAHLELSCPYAGASRFSGAWEYRDDTGRGGSVVCSAFEIAPSLVEASIRSTVPVLLPWAQLEQILVAHDGDMRVLPFLERSACALCVFSTECQAVSAAGVAAVLELVPSLQELRVIGMHAVGELVSRLVVPRDDGAPMMGSRRVEAMGARRCPALALCVLNYREFALSAEAVSAQALLRDEWGMEVEWRVSNDKIRSWELEYPW